MGRVRKWTMNVLVSLDQLIATALLGGDPDETISSRLGKLKRSHGGTIPWSRPFSRCLVWCLDKIDPGHCLDAIEDDEGGNGVR